MMLLKLTRYKLCAIVTLSIFALLYMCDRILYASEEQPQKTSKQNPLSDFITAENLSQRVINKVKLVILFLGHSRSGHSIVGSILDSHPHIVVSHELDLFNKMDVHPDWDKSDIFNALWQESVSSSKSGLRTEEEKAYRKGYSLAIPDLYQGTYESYIDVIGDKRGSKTTQLLKVDREHWKELLVRLKSVTGLPVKIFHVIRNPFDNIATSVLFFAKHSSNKTMSIPELKQEGLVHSFNPKWIDRHIVGYFRSYEAIEDAKVRFDLDVIEVHGKDLIADPKKVISEMCDFLQVTCSDRFISVCSDKIFPEESKTRYQLHWEEYQIKEVQKRIEKFSNLHRYIEFDS